MIPDLPIIPIAIFLAGLFLATLAAGPIIARIMRRFPAPEQEDGLSNAGRVIGILERAVIYLMVIMGEPSGIGFLIAAKSVARYELVSKNRAAAEYVIIGTLASFAWAILISFAADQLIDLLLRQAAQGPTLPSEGAA